MPHAVGGPLEVVLGAGRDIAEDDLLSAGLPIKEALQRQEPIQGYMQMLAQVDGPFVKECERAMNLSKEMARKWLKAHMLRGKNDAEVQRAVDEFSDPSRTLSHGRMIDYEQARSGGIEVEYIPKESDLWEAILELLFRSTNFLNMEASRIKLYESALVSLKSDAVLRAVSFRQ